MKTCYNDISFGFQEQAICGHDHIAITWPCVEVMNICGNGHPILETQTHNLNRSKTSFNTTPMKNIKYEKASMFQL